jgi:signal transduction histidine kinase
MPSVLLRPRWLTWRSALLAVPLLLVIWMGVSSYQNLRAFRERAVTMDRVFLLLGASTELLTEFEDAESGQRGYLLTGRKSYLAPYLAAVEKIDASFRQLIPLASVIHNGPERLARLSALANSKMAELKQTVDLYNSQGLSSSLEVVKTDAGLDDMARIRTELSTFILDAYQAREAQRRRGARATFRTNLLITFGAAALFLLLTFATVMIERDQLRQRLDALQIRDLNHTLEEKVRNRTQKLEEANRELEAFCYSVSHDLRAPLRSVDGFTKMLVRDYTGKTLDERANNLMQRMSASAIRMGQLIEDLLNLSRIGRGTVTSSSVDLSAVAQAVAQELIVQNPGRRLDVSIEPDLHAQGDSRLLRVAIENLFGNAWKFTRNKDQARLGFGQSHSPEGTVFFVRDNGVGFDMAHSKQLFVPFQRLHSDSEFEGTGIGLATVQRVIRCHGGRIWAESTPGLGSTFYFTIQNQVEAIA